MRRRVCTLPFSPAQGVDFNFIAEAPYPPRVDRVWTTRKQPQNVLAKMLPHPSFVYAARFHPVVDKVLVTGGFDRLVRVWSMQTDELHCIVSQREIVPIYFPCVCVISFTTIRPWALVSL